MTDTEHISDCMKDRYKEFLGSRDVIDNLEQLTWLYRSHYGLNKTDNEILIMLITEIDGTGREDAGFEDIRRQ